jgi:hypothetical protein
MKHHYRPLRVVFQGKALTFHNKLQHFGEELQQSIINVNIFGEELQQSIINFNIFREEGLILSLLKFFSNIRKWLK